jgi:hypothetical protein
MKNSEKINSSKRRRNFLLTFFKRKEGYEALEVNGFVLVKHWNGDGRFWTVDIFTPESYKAYRDPGIQETLL